LYTPDGFVRNTRNLARTFSNQVDAFRVLRRVSLAELRRFDRRSWKAACLWLTGFVLLVAGFGGVVLAMSISQQPTAFWWPYGMTMTGGVLCGLTGRHVRGPELPPYTRQGRRAGARRDAKSAEAKPPQ
jgi:hypothetical protein